MKYICIIIIGFYSLNLFAQTNPIVHGFELEDRLVYVRSNLQYQDDVNSIINILNTANDYCYTGIVLESNVLNYIYNYRESIDNRVDHTLDSSFGDRWTNLNTILNHAKSLGLDVYPKTAKFGASLSILVHNPNLAEGIPIVDAPFVVQNIGGNLQLANDPNDNFPLLNSNFNASNAEFSHWTVSSYAGTSAFNDVIFNVDDGSGGRCIKIEDPYLFGEGHVNVQQTVSGLQEFREYHISMKIKTQNYSNYKDISVEVFNQDKTQYLQWNKPTHRYPDGRIDTLPRTEDWRTYDMTFNTLDNSELTIAIRNWNGGTGTAWIDDIVITPTKFNNILKRDDTPIVIKDDAGNVLNENELKGSIVDPLLGRDRWTGNISIWHEQPQVIIPNSSNLVNGDKVQISYYTTTRIYNGGMYASLTHPDVYDITNEQLRQLESNFNQGSLDMLKGYFFGHDEIRMHGWDPTSGKNTPGQNLTHNFNTIYNQAKSIDSNVEVMVWNDMFDSYHNAETNEQRGRPYYLVDGYWDNSVGTLPNDVVVVNWIGAPEVNSNKKVLSCQHFSDLGHEQILAGFYDNDTFYTKDWLADLQNNGTQNIRGVMYTTWTTESDYSQLANWANVLWGGCNFNDCVDYRTINTSDITSDTDYGANIQINSNAVIQNGHVHFVAGNRICLENGFKYDSNNNGVFEATQGVCPD